MCKVRISRHVSLYWYLVWSCFQSISSQSINAFLNVLGRNQIWNPRRAHVWVQECWICLFSWIELKLISIFQLRQHQLLGFYPSCVLGMGGSTTMQPKRAFYLVGFFFVKSLSLLCSSVTFTKEPWVGLGSQIYSWFFGKLKRNLNSWVINPQIL